VEESRDDDDLMMMGTMEMMMMMMMTTRRRRRMRKDGVQTALRVVCKGQYMCCICVASSRAAWVMLADAGRVCR
jgi:hypothetical protein